jgi:wyosine [tRNA(Phe)-imidazoG37] synthetase (radical SAM superfamily)
MPPSIPAETATKSSVYGPVYSWRVGHSLGVDLLLQSAICSFNCIYCQLGEIQVKTSQRQIFVATDQVERDLRNSAWEKADIITFSGSGEPTLALNLGECIHMIKEYTGKAVMVLTNGTLLHDPQVRAELREADVVSAKLDASSEEGLTRMNRPVPGVTLEKIVSGIAALRQEYTGRLCLQCMFMPANLMEVEALAAIIQRIQPDEVQLNTPKRPYPLQWMLESRGNHGEVEYPAVKLRTLSMEQAAMIESLLHEKTGVPIVSVYKKEEAST